MRHDKRSVKYLQVGAPARDYGIPFLDWFKYGPNETATFIETNGNFLVFGLDGMDSMRVYELIEGNANSTVLEITFDGGDVSLFDLGADPILASAPEIALLPSHCCTDPAPDSDAQFGFMDAIVTDYASGVKIGPLPSQIIPAFTVDGVILITGTIAIIPNDDAVDATRGSVIVGATFGGPMTTFSSALAITDLNDLGIAGLGTIHQVHFIIDLPAATTVDLDLAIFTDNTSGGGTFQWFSFKWEFVPK